MNGVARARKPDDMKWEIEKRRSGLRDLRLTLVSLRDQIQATIDKYNDDPTFLPEEYRKLIESGRDPKSIRYGECHVLSQVRND